MALTFASYAAPDGWSRPVAVAAVLALRAVNYRGVTRTARLTRVIVTVVLLALAVVVLASLVSGQPRAGRITDDLLGAGWYGILQSAGLLFFAFAGYARIATMGEEVREPRRTIPRAIVLALTIALLLYVGVAVSILAVLGADGVASTAAHWRRRWTSDPGRGRGRSSGSAGAAAALGALLALVAGIGRTSLAMGRNGDLPRWLSAVHPVHRVPHHAEVVLGVTISVLVLFVDLRGAIGFSSFGVLIYYSVANLAAFTQSGDDRRYPRVLQVVGVGGCGLLVATLPPASIAGGSVVYIIGIGYRLWRTRDRR
jgi:APA family basic amino acid/polyamine antiporter